MPLINRLITFLFLLVAGTTFSQIRYNSPYSSIGMGDLQTSTTAFNRGMNGLGLSNSNEFFYNGVNPALLHTLDYSNFEFALKLVNHKVTSNNTTTSTADGVFDYFSIAMPLGKKNGLALGLAPVTDVAYKYEVISDVEGSDNDYAVITNQGEGGLNRLYISNGMEVYHKEVDQDTIMNFSSLSLGLEADYVFGTIEKETSSLLYIDDVPEPTSASFYNHNRYGSFAFKGGLSAKKSLNPMTDIEYKINDTTTAFRKARRFKGTYMNLGVTYNIPSSVSGEGLEVDRQVSSNGSVIEADTTDNINLTLNLPQILGFGISFDHNQPRGTNIKGKKQTAVWTIGADMYLTDWSSFENANSGVSYGQGYKVIVGGEIARDFYNVDTRRKKSFLNKYIYKAGVGYEVLPYKLNDKPVTELSFSGGLTIPLGNVGNNKSVDLADKPKFLNISGQYILRRSAGVDLDDDIFQLSVSFTMNHKWFVRRKYGL